MKKVHVIVGTRPDAIKMAPVYKALKSKKDLEVKLISTGQHKELLQQVFDSFSLVPDVDLQVMRAGQSLTQLTMGILNKMENLYQTERPDLVLAHGDTTTCYSSALSAFYHAIPFFHVEAGLRTYRIDSPFPEEFNRQSVAHLSTHHFAPTQTEKINLLRDGILEKAITVTGGTIHDAIQDMGYLTKNQTTYPDHKQIVLFTLHRREHLDQFKGMMNAIKKAALTRSDVLFICPLHPSPLVKAMASDIFSGLKNIILTDPLKYPDFLALMARSNLIVTDSGGIQEEAAFLGKKALILREKTERQDGLESGLVHLIGNNPCAIESHILKHLDLTSLLPKPKALTNMIQRASDVVAAVVHEQCTA